MQQTCLRIALAATALVPLVLGYQLPYTSKGGEESCSLLLRHVFCALREMI
jgi:hypothetical protein